VTYRWRHADIAGPVRQKEGGGGHYCPATSSGPVRDRERGGGDIVQQPVRRMVVPARPAGLPTASFDDRRPDAPRRGTRGGGGVWYTIEKVIIMWAYNYI
jgi:hypothetical protein